MWDWSIHHMAHTHTHTTAEASKSQACPSLLTSSHGQSLLHAGSGADSKGKAPVGSVRDGGVPCELALLQHYKVINSAYFSPITGEQGRRVCVCVCVCG
jgi:hypothetical protein